jgi:hypothetical protein
VCWPPHSRGIPLLPAHRFDCSFRVAPRSAAFNQSSSSGLRIRHGGSYGRESHKWGELSCQARGVAANPDGTFIIPDVPAGFYRLQLSPTGTYWTSTSSFDAGVDVVGSPQKWTTQNTTTLNIALTGLDPIEQKDMFSIQTNTRGFAFGLVGAGVPGTTTLNSVERLTSDIDFSQINTHFFNQFEPVDSEGFSGLALGPALTQSNVTITTGAVNNISGTLTASPKASIPLDIKGSS